MRLSKTFEEEEILSMAMKKYGLDSQIGMVMEECGELLTALNQYKRGRIDKKRVAEEIADVIILMSQMSMVFGERDVKKNIDEKMWNFKQTLSEF